MAVELGCKNIAFPAISTGIYGYPKDEAAQIAYNVVKNYLKGKDEMEVHLVFHNNEDKELFMKTIQEK
jgi:O-acetyl-ADP-ribose deacetylase (regulator of RNase III)